MSCWLCNIIATKFAIYFDTLGVQDIQFRNQSVLSMLMCHVGCVIYFSIKPTKFAIYFDTLGVQDIQFRNQSVLSMLMWIITKTF